MTKEPSMNDVQEPITSAPSEVRQIIEQVLQAEKDKPLHEICSQY